MEKGRGGVMGQVEIGKRGWAGTVRDGDGGEWDIGKVGVTGVDEKKMGRGLGMEGERWGIGRGRMGIKRGVVEMGKGGGGGGGWRNGKETGGDGCSILDPTSTTESA